VLAAAAAPAAFAAHAWSNGVWTSYAADPGEWNELWVEFKALTSVTLHDNGAEIRAGDHCTSVNAHTVTCRTQQGSIDVGDGDDFVDVRYDIRTYTLVRGGAGDDTLRGAVAMEGGEGNDTLEADSGGTSAHGGPGSDTLSSSGDYRDHLDGGDGSDTLHAGGGLDHLSGGADADLIDGGEGEHDFVLYLDRTSPVTVDLDGEVGDDGEVGEGDTVTGVEHVRGGLAGDLIVGSEGRNTFEGRAGADTLIGHGENDVLSGREGADVLLGGAGRDILRGGPGSDVLDGGTGADDLRGHAPSIGIGDGVDVADYSSRTAPITVTLNGMFSEHIRNVDDGEASEGDTVDETVEVVFGGSGDDVLVAMLVQDNFFEGRDGDDTLDGGPGADILRGGAGEDTLKSRDGVRDELFCGEGTDSVFVDELDVVAADCEGVDFGPPIIATGTATDVGHAGATVAGSVNPMAATTTYWFEYGTTTSYGAATPAQTLDAGIAAVSITATISSLAPDTTYFYRLAAANASGTSYGQSLSFRTSLAPPPPPPVPVSPCTLVGTPGADVLVGTPGADVICALGGADTVSGGGGDDHVRAGGGADSVRGGDGNDILVGGRGLDVLAGDRGRDRIRGGLGRDRVLGGRGPDVLFGDAAGDALTGGLGSDSIRGGSGRDAIFARDRRRDFLNGGAGVDRALADRIDRVKSVERVSR
jgi:Ca2+-binding RTX toxin-like protein